MVRELLSGRVTRWPGLLEALFHQHDHDRVVEGAIMFVFGERYRVTVRRCRCGHHVQTVECAEHLRHLTHSPAVRFQFEPPLRRAV